MKMRDFIRQNRKAIDAVINAPPGGRPDLPRNDGDREQWVRNHEGLYHMARRSGVKV